LFVKAREQVDFVIKPRSTRNYSIRTFRESGTILVLFEEDDGELRYRSADDDSGRDYNARIRYRLFKGHRYVIRARLFYQHLEGQFAMMMW